MDSPGERTISAELRKLLPLVLAMDPEPGSVADQASRCMNHAATGLEDAEREIATLRATVERLEGEIEQWKKVFVAADRGARLWCEEAERLQSVLAAHTDATAIRDLATFCMVRDKDGYAPFLEREGWSHAGQYGLWGHPDHGLRSTDEALRLVKHSLARRVLAELDAVSAARAKAGAYPVSGTWPADDLRRWFVDGAAWWEYRSRGATLWQSDRVLAEEEADNRFAALAESDPLHRSPRLVLEAVLTRWANGEPYDRAWVRQTVHGETPEEARSKLALLDSLVEETDGSAEACPLSP